MSKTALHLFGPAGTEYKQPVCFVSPTNHPCTCPSRLMIRGRDLRIPKRIQNTVQVSALHMWE